MDQHNSSLLGNLILGAVALILFGAIFWAANYFLNSPKLSQKPAATATPLPSASGDIKGAEKELTEIPFEDAASGEKKEINGIKINQEVSIGDLPKGVEVGPLKPGENVADTGFYIRKDGNDIVNSEGGHYDGYTVSGIGNIVYIMVSLSNTGTGGDFQDHYVFVYDKSDGSLKQLNDDRITFTGSDPLIINYKNHLYIKAAYTSHTSHDPADALQGFSLLVLDDKGAKTDDRSLESRKGSWNADASLVERDNKLYIRVKNNYYYAIEGKNEQTDEDIPLHAGAADEYYLLGDNGKMIASSVDFKDQYLKNALTYDGGIKNDAGGKDWLSPLLARTMNYILAGEEEKAWEDFDADFSRLNSKYPLESSADPGKIREDVSKISDGA